MRRSLMPAAWLVFLAAAISSTYAQMGPPTPAPELKKLEMFTGDWTAEGTQTPEPGVPSSKWSMTTHSEWMEGNFFLVERSDLDLGAMGKGKNLAVMGFDPDRGVYTYRAFSSFGEVEDAAGKLEGDTFTWASTEHMGGKTMQGRFTMKILSPTSYTMKFELSSDGKQWVTGMEGKATKK
jgi:Protein of unknown function (DUF1579)